MPAAISSTLHIAQYSDCYPTRTTGNCLLAGDPAQFSASKHGYPPTNQGSHAHPQLLKLRPKQRTPTPWRALLCVRRGRRAEPDPFGVSFEQVSKDPEQLRCVSRNPSSSFSLRTLKRSACFYIAVTYFKEPPDVLYRLVQTGCVLIKLRAGSSRRCFEVGLEDLRTHVCCEPLSTRLRAMLFVFVFARYFVVCFTFGCLGLNELQIPGENKNKNTLH